MPDDDVGSGKVVVCQKGSISARTGNDGKQKGKKAISGDIALSRFASLESLHVFSLPALGALGHVELHRLALLQALETACLDR
jgi:hypothetical protein